MTTEAVARLSLQVLFPQQPELESSDLERAFLKADSLFAGVDIVPPHIRFGSHNVLFAENNSPMKSEDTEKALGDVRCDRALKELVRGHESHVVVSYNGEETNPLQVYKLLTLVSSVLCTRGASAVVNCNGHACADSRQLLRLLGDSNWFRVIDEEMPICFVISAVTCHCFDENPYYFARTYGNEFLNVPNVGSCVLDRQWASMEQEIIDTFSNVTSYMLDSGNVVAPGDTMEIDGDDMFIRFCTEEEVARTWNRQVNEPLQPDEFFLESPSGLLHIDFSPTFIYHSARRLI